MTLQLIIGNKNYSSWSLRAWLFLKESQIEFEELRIPLFTQQWMQTIDQYSETKRVPVLIDKSLPEAPLAIWDTAAIYDYVLTHYPARVGWPRDRRAGALARSMAAEMHAGFLGIRGDLPQNIRSRHPLQRQLLPPATQQEIHRVESLWQTCYERYGGPWLFGDFSIADVVYAPVALRFVTYNIPVSPMAQSFIAAVQALPSIQQWAQDSATESEIIAFIDELRPATESDLASE